MIQDLSTFILLDIADGTNTQYEYTAAQALAELKARKIPLDDEWFASTARGGIHPQHIPTH